MNMGDLDLRYITSEHELVQAAYAIFETGIIFVDTEFDRVGTYYPKISIIQVLVSDAVFIIDVLALKSRDIKPLKDVMESEQVLKVLHAVRQDAEGLYYDLGITLKNVFDTQLGMLFCGVENEPSYSAMIDQYVGITLKKDMQFSDWMQRPLSKKQLMYAALDVFYMKKPYTDIALKLQNERKYAYCIEESEENIRLSILRPKTASIFGEIYSCVSKELFEMDIKFLLYLLRLCKWRDTMAFANNKSRRNVIKDTELINLTKQYIKFANNKQIESVYIDLVSSATSEERELIEHSLNSRDSYLEYDKGKFNALRTQIDHIASTVGISSKLIANKKDIIDIVLGKPSRLHNGWRFEVCQDVLEL